MSSSSRVFSKIRKGSKSSLFIEGIIRDADHGVAKRFSTIGAMRDSGISLKRSCGACGAVSEVMVDEEIETHGADAPLTDLAGACSACGEKRVSVLIS